MAQVLRQLGYKFPQHDHPELLVGLHRADDAAVYKLNEEQAIVQTLDFFAPLVDDPYQYGAIAAANAMSDVYAMGADVILALNIAAFPEDLPAEIVARVFEGGADKVREAGGVIAGGHTIIDEEPKYGLCVTGLVHPARVRTNATAQAGDAIVLTKPLGTGIIITAIRKGKVTPQHEEAALRQMMTLNRATAEVCRDFDIHGTTDVTGFGLVGHLYELASNSGARVALSLAALPPMDGLAEYVEMGFSTAGQDRNREFFAPRLEIDHEPSAYEDALLYDPQTSGGLLVALPEADAEALRRRLTDAGVPSWRIGAVRDGEGIRVTK